MDCKRGPNDGFYARQESPLLTGFTQESVAKAAAGFVEAVKKMGLPLHAMVLPSVGTTIETIEYLEDVEKILKKPTPKTGPPVNPYAKRGLKRR